MGTAYIKAKLFKQMTGMREEVLYELFINLWKVYETLDREWCMEILVGYGVGSRM